MSGEVIDRLNMQERICGERFKSIETKIDDIHHAIVGNGNPGLARDVSDAKGQILAIKWVGASIAFAVTTISGVMAWLL